MEVSVLQSNLLNTATKGIVFHITQVSVSQSNLINTEKNVILNQESMKLYIKPVMTLTFHTDDFSSSINYVISNL